MPRFKFCPLCAAPLAERMEQGEARSACSAQCGFVHYDNPTPVVAAVVEHNGMVVLAHNRAWPERLRSPEQCAMREVKEELDLDGATATLIGVYPFEQMNQVIIAYHVDAGAGEQGQVGVRPPLMRSESRPDGPRIPIEGA